jgi:hypothetical protein
MDDRRTEVRKKLMVFTPVRDRTKSTLLGFLGNLTLQGALVIGEKPLEVNHLAHLDIEFADELPGISSRHLLVRARVARCVKDEESQRDFKIGFEFIEIQPEQTQIIEALLAAPHTNTGSIEVGGQVRTPKFGIGTVVAIDGNVVVVETAHGLKSMFAGSLR